MIKVELPDKNVTVDFPDDMKEFEIKNVIESEFYGAPAFSTGKDTTPERPLTPEDRAKATVELTAKDYGLTLKEFQEQPGLIAAENFGKSFQAGAVSSFEGMVGGGQWLSTKLPYLNRKTMDVLSRNKDKNFVQRILNPGKSPYIDLGDGNFATHKMASAEVDGKYIAYPTVVQLPGDRELTQLSGNDAFRYALDNKEYIEFNTDRKAKEFADNGYKSVWKEPAFKINKYLEKVADNLGAVAEDLQPEDNTFLNKLGGGFGSMATFFIPGIGAMKGVEAVSRVSLTLAKIAGISVASAMESLTEAGSTYREVLEKTGDQQKADAAATRTFNSNMILLPITNKLGVFGESGKKLKKIGMSFLMEGSQEAFQRGISEAAKVAGLSIPDFMAKIGAKTFTKEGFEEAIIGGLVGAGTSAITETYESFDEKRRDQPAPIPEQEAALGAIPGTGAGQGQGPAAGVGASAGPGAGAGPGVEAGAETGEAAGPGAVPGSGQATTAGSPPAQPGTEGRPLFQPTSPAVRQEPGPQGKFQPTSPAVMEKAPASEQAQEKTLELEPAKEATATAVPAIPEKQETQQAEAMPAKELPSAPAIEEPTPAKTREERHAEFLPREPLPGMEAVGKVGSKTARTPYEIKQLRREKDRRAAWAKDWLSKNNNVPFEVKPWSDNYAKDRGMMYIATPSTRNPGKWQLTWVDKDGPAGHTEYDSYEDLINNELTRHNEFDVSTMKSIESKKGTTPNAPIAKEEVPAATQETKEPVSPSAAEPENDKESPSKKITDMRPEEVVKEFIRKASADSNSPYASSTINNYANKFIKRLVGFIYNQPGKWFSIKQLKHPLPKQKRSREDTTSRDIRHLINLGYLQVAWDNLGNPFYARADTELPAWLARSSDISSDEDLAKLPSREEVENNKPPRFSPEWWLDLPGEQRFNIAKAAKVSDMKPLANMAREAWEAFSDEDKAKLVNEWKRQSRPAAPTATTTEYDDTKEPITEKPPVTEKEKAKQPKKQEEPKEPKQTDKTTPPTETKAESTPPPSPPPATPIVEEEATPPKTEKQARTPMEEGDITERDLADKTKTKDVEGDPIVTGPKGKYNPKDQKEYLLEAIDNAIEDAPQYRDKEEKFTKVRIRVPGDGIFIVDNLKSTLEAFKKTAKKTFPGSGKKEPKIVTNKKISFRQSNVRPTPDKDLVYVTEYIPRRIRKGAFVKEIKSGDVGTGAAPTYKTGVWYSEDKKWVTNGNYILKKNNNTEIPDDAEDLGVIKIEEYIKNNKKNTQKAEIVAEFYNGVGDYPFTVIKKEDGDLITVYAEYADIVLTSYPAATVSVNEAETVILFSDKGEVVGAIIVLRQEVPNFVKDWIYINSGKEKTESAKEEPTKGEPAPEPEQPKQKQKRSAPKGKGQADVGGYASTGEYKKEQTQEQEQEQEQEQAKEPEKEAEKEKEKEKEPVPLSFDMPDLVDLVERLMGGKLPGIVRRLRISGAVGVFRPGTGRIELLSSLFKDTEQALKTLAHEIGHLVDWLPDKDLRRGNIFGRIKSLKGFTGRIIWPENSKGPLTEEDKKRLREIAENIIGKGEEWIDEIITKTMPITPEDVLAIWNDMNFDKLLNKELYEYVAKLSAADKKSIIREAMKGAVASELQRFAKTITTKTSKKVLVPKQADKADIKAKYEELIKEEIVKRHIYYLNDVIEELKRFTVKWKPFTPKPKDKFTRYRFSSKELYADAISALLTNPAYLRTEAPIFYEAFFEFIDAKPRVKEVYDEIQADIRSGKSKDNLIKRIFKGFNRREEELRQGLKRKKEDKRHIMSDIWGIVFVDNYFSILRKVKKIGDSNIPAHLNPRYAIENYQYSESEKEGYAVSVRNDVVLPLEKANLTADSFGFYLFCKRIASGDRVDLANPHGVTKKEAEEMLPMVFNEEELKVLEKAQKDFRAIRKKYLLDKIKDNSPYSKELMNAIENTDNYATFDIVGHMDANYGREASSQIFRQIGTFSATGNPFSATIAKDFSLMLAINKNIAAKSTVIFLNKHFSNEISDAKKEWDGKRHSYVESKDKKNALMTYMENGELKGFYVPKYIAESFHTNYVEGNIIIQAYEAIINLGRVTASPFKFVFTRANPGFWAFNTIKDYKRLAKNLPKGTLINLAKYYKRAAVPSIRRVLGRYDNTIDSMLKGNMLVSVADFSGSSEEDTRIERMLSRYHIAKPKWDNKIIKPIATLLDYYLRIGEIIETVPKVAGYSYLKDKFPNMPEERIAHIIRSRAGSPAFLRTGSGYGIYNNLFLFSNATKEGIRGDIESFRESKAEYTWKTFKYDVIPKMAMFAALLGWLGDELKEVMRRATNFDKTNYSIIPFASTKSGKGVYLRIPQDEIGRLVGGIVWQLLDHDRPHLLNNMFDYMSGQAPTLHPMLNVVWAVTDYMSGKNPYDHFRNNFAVPEQIFTAGQGDDIDMKLKSHKEFAKWVSNQIGLGIVYKFKYDDPSEIKAELEKILGYPIISNIMGRFIKVTDYGLREEIREEVGRKVDSEDARQSILAKEAFQKMMDGEKSFSEDEIMAFANKINMMPKLMQKALADKTGNVYLEEIVAAQSNKKKFAIMGKYLKDKGIEITSEPNKPDENE